MIASRICATALLLFTACSDSEQHAEEGEHGEEGHAEEEEHADEVVLSPEAIEQSGIRLVSVERRALDGGVAIPAEVEFDPKGIAHVVPLVSGRLTSVPVRLGDQVEVDQLLATVKSSDVSEVRSRLDQARARLVSAEAALGRQEKLSSDGIGAKRSLVEAEADVAGLGAEIRGLRNELRLLGSGKSGDVQLRSPKAGLISDLHATLGEIVGTDDTVFTIVDPDDLWVQGYVPELELARARVDMPALVRLHAFPELVLRGKVTYLAPAIDEATRSLPITVTLDEGQFDERLRAGLFGSVELLEGSVDERVLAVPITAIANLDGLTVVFTRADEPGGFRARRVRLGRRAGGWIEVVDGVAEQDEVVVEGVFVLKSAMQAGELSEGHAH